MHVQLLVFEGCPLATPARENLKKALKSCGLDSFEEIDISESGKFEEMRGWGSPTILVNGLDINGHQKGEGACCRIYPTPSGAPDVATIISSLESHTG